MRHVSSKIGAICATLALGFGLAGCAGGGSHSSSVDPQSVKKGEISGDISFQTWSLKNDKFTPYFTSLIKKFEKKYPKVHVKWIDQPGDGYEDKLLQQANANSLPDVVNIPPEYGMSLAKAHRLLDLQTADEQTMQKYVKGGQKAYQYYHLKGTYAYPWYLGVVFNYWNKDALKKAGIDQLPTNEKEFIEDAKTAAAHKIALMNTTPSAGFFAARGVKVWDASKRQFIFNNPQAVKILETYVQLFKAGAMPPELLTAVDNGQPANEAFYKGTLGAIQSTPSFADAIKKDAPTLMDKVSVSEPWEKPQLLVQGIGVSANSKHPAAALAFAQFVTNNQNQIDFVKIAKGFLPGTIDGNKNPMAFSSPSDSPLLKNALKVSAQTVQRAQMLTPLEMSNEMKTAVIQQVSLAMEGKKSAKAALDEAVQKCNKLVKDADK